MFCGINKDFLSWRAGRLCLILAIWRICHWGLRDQGGGGSRAETAPASCRLPVCTVLGTVVGRSGARGVKGRAEGRRPGGDGWKCLNHLCLLHKIASSLLLFSSPPHPRHRGHSQSQQTLTPSRTSLTQSLTKWGREPPPPKQQG